MGESLKFSQEQAIRELLLGRSVSKVTDDTLVLDDGTTLRIEPNVGGCVCGAGDYYLTELNGCVNAIMAVEFTDEAGDEIGESPHTYRIFVLAENKRIKLLEVSGDDGNGYYGTGYWIEVVK